jgi:hypothetical protein
LELLIGRCLHTWETGKKGNGKINLNETLINTPPPYFSGNLLESAEEVVCEEEDQFVAPLAPGVKNGQENTCTEVTDRFIGVLQDFKKELFDLEEFLSMSAREQTKARMKIPRMIGTAERTRAITRDCSRQLIGQIRLCPRAIGSARRRGRRESGRGPRTYRTWDTRRERKKKKKKTGNTKAKQNTDMDWIKQKINESKKVQSRAHLAKTPQ